MNLLCPNCQKMLQVPEQYAGQLMKCPLCTGTFTVPALPQAPPPPPPPPAQTPPLPEPNVPSGKGAAQESAAAKKAPAPATGDYAHVRSYTLNPRVLPWVTPVCLVAVFILLFFTWVGMYPAGIQVFSQNGWQAAFHGYTDDTRDGEVWRAANRADMEYVRDNLGSGVFLILFVILVPLVVLLALAVLLVQYGLVPVPVPPGFASVWSLRSLILAALCAAALVLLLLQLTSGFPLEDTVWAQAKTAASRDKPAPETEEQRSLRRMDEGKEYGKFNVQSTNLVWLVVLLMVLATLGAVLEWWVERRGTLPPPRLDLSY